MEWKKILEEHDISPSYIECDFKNHPAIKDRWNEVLAYGKSPIGNIFMKHFGFSPYKRSLISFFIKYDKSFSGLINSFAFLISSERWSRSFFKFVLI